MQSDGKNCLREECRNSLSQHIVNSISRTLNDVSASPTYLCGFLNNDVFTTCVSIGRAAAALPLLAAFAGGRWLRSDQARELLPGFA